jgi:hypothetical protein
MKRLSEYKSRSELDRMLLLKCRNAIKKIVGCLVYYKPVVFGLKSEDFSLIKQMLKQKGILK